MARVAEIWRHPVKAHGRERIDQVTLEAGKAMPWDLIGVGALSATLLALSGALYFRRMERTFADVA